MPVHVSPGFRDLLAGRPQPLGAVWVTTESPVAAEICAGAGLDLVLIDLEHSVGDVRSTLQLLRAIERYPVAPVVRTASQERAAIQPLLDVGASTIMVPMIESVRDAERVVATVRYPPAGVRGVGGAFTRATRWGQDPAALTEADPVSVIVQIETVRAIEAAREIAVIDGVDALFIGPADLAASMGLLGRATDPRVVALIEATIADLASGGATVGVNAFDPSVAARYVAAGASFVALAADATMLVGATARVRTDLDVLRGV